MSSKIIALLLLSFTVSARAEYHQIKPLQFGGNGGWDYLTADSESRRLFIARNDRIMVVDLDSGKLIHEVPGVDGAHGIALDPELNIGFASAGRANQVIAFDLKTYTPMAKIPVGEKPDAILYDAFSHQVFVFNGKTRSVSIINPSMMKVAATIELPGKPEFSVTDDAGHVYDDIEDKGVISVIDTKTNHIEKTFPVSPCEEPSALAINDTKSQLIVGCGNKMAAIVDTHSGKILKTLPAGDHIDADFFDSKHHLAFVSAGEGRLTIVKVSGARSRVVQDLQTEKGARTLAFDSKTGKIYLASAKFGPPEKPNSKRPSIVPDTFHLLVIAP